MLPRGRALVRSQSGRASPGLDRRARVAAYENLDLSHREVLTWSCCDLRTLFAAKAFPAGRRVRGYGWSGRRSTRWRHGMVTARRGFCRVEAARKSFWATLTRGQDRYDVYLLNDRGGIYALGLPVISALGHLVNLAEVTVLAVSTYLLLLLGNFIYNWLGGRETTAPALLREIRASFYRKLFLAFVAVFVPVVARARHRNYGLARGSPASNRRRSHLPSRRVVRISLPRAAQEELA